MNNQEFNPNKLIIAREYNKLTQGQFLEKLKLGCAVKLSQGELSKIERGERKYIPYDILSAFSQVLDFPIDYFYTEGSIIDVKLALFRKRQKLTKKAMSFILGSVNIFSEACKYLLDETKEININIPYLSLEKYKTPQEIARTLRTFWKVPAGPIVNLTELLEDNGIIVNFIDPETDKFDGYSYSQNGLYFIFVNVNLSGDRLRFTLAHELGHTIMKNETFIYKEAEDTSNMFASEFLMPELEIKHSLKNINFEKAYYLKSYWKVSIAALFRRAFDLGLITKSRYESLNCYLSQLGFRKSEPNPVEKEAPSLFKEIIDSYVQDDDYTTEDIAKKAHLKKNVLVKIHRPERNKIEAIN